MDNTNENETPLFGEKPEAESVATPIFATPSAEPTPSAPTAPVITAPQKSKKTGLIIGCIIAGLILIAAAVVLIVILVNRQPETAPDEKTVKTSKSEEKPLKKIENEEEPKEVDDEDKDEPKDINDDKGEEEGKKEDENKDTPVSSQGNSTYTLNIADKSLGFGSKKYIDVIKNALDAGFTMTYDEPTTYKDISLTKSNLAEYSSLKTKYGSTESSILDGNGDAILRIYGVRDYSAKQTDPDYSTVGAASFEKIQYSSTLPLTLPDGNKISCHNTTKEDVEKLYGKAESSSSGIVHYHKGGLDLSFHFESEGTISSLFIRLD